MHIRNPMLLSCLLPCCLALGACKPGAQPAPAATPPAAVAISPPATSAPPPAAGLTRNVKDRVAITG